MAPGAVTAARSTDARRTSSTPALRLLQGGSGDPAIYARMRNRHTVQLELDAGPEAPAEARRVINDLVRDAGAGPDERDAVATIVSEGVTNAVRHGYCSGPGSISVDATVQDGELTLVILDTGRGLRDASPDPGMGLGWRLIAELSDRWAVLPRAEAGTLLYAQLRLNRA